MKLGTKVFILLQLLDIVLTFFAIRFGIAGEANPLGFTVTTILLKFYVIVFVSVVLEKVNFGKLVYIVLLVPFLFVVWNSFIIGYVVYLASK